MSAASSPVEDNFRISDSLWERIQALLPAPEPKPKGGRPPKDDRRMMDAIFYLLRTGSQWKALPRKLGASSTVHDRFQKWQREQVFVRLWQAGLLEFDQRVGLDWQWQSMDGAMTKAPLGGKIHRAQPLRPRQKGHQAKRAHRGTRTTNRRGCRGRQSA